MPARAFPALRRAIRALRVETAPEVAADLERRLKRAEWLAERRLQALRKLAAKLRECRAGARELRGRLDAAEALVEELRAEVERLRQREPATGPVGGLLAKLGKAKEGGDE